MSSAIQHHPNLIPRIYHLKDTQCAAGLFRGSQQVAIFQRKLVLVQGTSNDASLNRRRRQWMATVRAVCLQQEQLAMPLDQQHLQVVYFELADIVVVEIDQFFQRIKAHLAACRLQLIHDLPDRSKGGNLLLPHCLFQDRQQRLHRGVLGQFQQEHFI